MKLFLRVLCSACLCFSLAETTAQCPEGYTKAAVNWDAMAFLMQSSYVSNSIAANQKFAFGKNQMTITHNYAAANTLGDNADHTGSAGSYGEGADVQFVGDGTITVTFQSAVQNVKFSIYDIDQSQSIQVSATDGATPKNVTLSTIGVSILTITNNNTSAPFVSENSAKGTLAANTSNTGTVNVDIAGPITSFTLTITKSGKVNGNKENGEFWLSDIAACTITDPFPSAYRQVARPFTNQPGYVLAARNNIIYAVDPATGRAVELFSDPSNQNINSMGYDPHNRILYFTNSLTGSGGSANANNKTLKKYDFNSETLSVVVSDVTAALGIPVFGSGVESGGASFYDGALYLGIEGTSSTRSTIWRIDFDASLNPVSAKQAFGIALEGHDWGDFVIANGILYDFDGAASGKENVFHVDLQTGAFNASHPAPFGIRQVAADWTEQVFNIGGAPGAIGEVASYNYNGTVAPLKNITVGTTAPSGSWGDAAEAFKPKADFGDAPASYDPDPMSPALHEKDVNLKLGTKFETEWNKLSTNNTDDDDDGLKFVRILNTGGGSYEVTALVYNNTGNNAIVGAWIDFNGNGQYESNEGVSVTVGSSPATQEVSLYWNNIKSNLPANSHTYLRVRVTSESASRMMTTADATGYFMNGEVEDWYVIVNVAVLPLQLNGFSAKKKDESSVQVNWSVAEEREGTLYELQKSYDGVNWQTFYQKQVKEDRQASQYQFVDINSTQSMLYYRLKYTVPGASTKHSVIHSVLFASVKTIRMYPNPASDYININVWVSEWETAQLLIMNVGGKIVYSKTLPVSKGQNTITLPLPQLPEGIYSVLFSTTLEQYTQKLVIRNK